MYARPLRYFLIALCISQLTFGQSGQVNAFYGNQGTAQVGLSPVLEQYYNAYGRAVAHSNNGKLWVGADYQQHDKSTAILMRLTAGGDLDPTFNAHDIKPGTKVIAFGGDSTVSIQDIQEDAQGRLVFCGILNTAGINQVYVGRVQANGQLDPGFGNGGFAMISPSPDGDQCYELAMQADNSILVSVLFGIGGSNQDAGVIKIRTDGILDSDFGNGGIARVDVAGYNDFANRIRLDAQGRIVLAGQVSTNASTTVAALLRFSPAGIPDQTFGISGVLQIPVSASGYKLARAFEILADGSFLVTGVTFANFGFSKEPFFCKISDQGVLDANFNHLGVTGFGVAGIGSVDPYDLALDTTGNTILATAADFPQQNRLFRFSGNGTRDVSFGGSGTFILQGTLAEFPDNIESYQAVLGPDGNLTVVSRCPVTSSLQGVLVSRITPSGVFVSTFNGTGQSNPLFTTNSDQLTQAAVLPDGSAYLVGRTLLSETEEEGQRFGGSLVRLLPDGKVDPSFGTGGKRLVDLGSPNSRFNTVLPIDNGKIYVAGVGQASVNEFVISRLGADGSDDAAFGTTGTVRMPMSNGSGFGQGAQWIAKDGGNRLLVAGLYHSGGNNYITVLRLNEDGSPDAGFASNGRFTDGLPYSPFGGEIGVRVLTASTNKILVVAGCKSCPPGQGNWRVIRLNADGTLDTGFSQDGITEVDYGVETLRFAGAALGIGDQLYVLGTYGNSNASLQTVLGKVQPDGNLAPGFGANGIAVLNNSLSGEIASAIQEWTPGKLAVLSNLPTGLGTDQQTRIRWLLSNGNIDPTMGSAGVSNFISTGNRLGLSLASTPVGLLYAAGYGSNNYSKEDFWITALQVPENVSALYFRSRQSGLFNSPYTWEYSTDSASWSVSPVAPGISARSIVVRPGHDVQYGLFNAELRNVIVEVGGILRVIPGAYMKIIAGSGGLASLLVNGAMIVESGGPIDIEVQSGSEFLVNGQLSMFGGAITPQGSLATGLLVAPGGVLNLDAVDAQGVVGLVNYGTVNWKQGNIVLKTGSGMTNYGTWNDSANAIISSRSSIRFRNYGIYRKFSGTSGLGGSSGSSIVNEGLLTGAGTLDLRRGDSSLNLGTIQPGLPIGTLTLLFSQPNTLDTLGIDMDVLDSRKHDVLEVGGALSLGGHLAVNPINELPDGSYTIIRKVNDGSLSGAFATTNLPPNYSIQYLTDSVVLTKIAVVSPKNISISNPTAVTEGNAGQKELKFVVRLNQASTGTVRVNYATADSTATAGEDYAATSGSLTIPAGQLTDTVRVSINGDRLVEGVERMKVVLSNAVNAIITTAQAIGTINNDDVLPAISITSYSITEGTGRDSLQQVQVRLANAYPLPVTVNFATADSTATDGTDYTGVSGTLTFAPGDTLEFIPVLVKGDGIDEANEIVNVNLSNAVNATLTATTRGRITINDDDQIPGIVVSNVTVTEKDIVDTVIQVPVRLNRRYVETVTINYTSADSTATSGIDYDAVSGVLTFVPGDTLEFIPINIRGDRIDEPNEIIKLSYFGVVNATPASASSRVAINDNDVLPAVQFTNLSVPEGNSGGTAALTLQVRLSKAYPLPVTVAYATSDSTAIAGDDYTTVSGTLSFAPEETVQTISLPVNGDYLAEGTEIIKLRFSSPTNATVSATPSRVSLANDDVYPTITASAATITEGNTGVVNQVVTVRLSKRYPLPVTVQLATSDLTAAAGQDYTATSTTLVFPALGDTLQTVLVPVIGDLLDEANETYRITLSNPQYGILGGGGIATATINDNDPVPAIRVSDSIAAEADGQISFRVSLNNPSGRVVMVNWATQNGTALAGADYTAVVSGSLSFQPGETEKIVVVSLLTDSEAEPNETFTLLLSGAVNGTLTTAQGGDATATGTIQNSVSSSVNRSNSGSGLMDRSPSAPLQVKVLPNPSTNRFTLNFSGGSSEKILLRVTDIQGRAVEARTLGAGMQTVQVGESWNSGTYIVEVVQGSDRKTLQLVKLK